MAGLGRYIVDGLKNVLTGLGMAADSQSTYAFCPLTPEAIEAFYRGSGIGRKAIDIPAFDAVREWRDWQAKADQIELLEAEESRLDIRAKVRQVEILRGLGGGALVLGAPGDPAMPINERGVGKGQLAFVHVVSRWQLTLGEMVEDPADPNFGGPKYFTLNTTGKPLRLHPSRVVCFKADPLPNIIGTGWEDQFWGESRVARLMTAVKNSDTAQSAFVSLVQKARYTRIGIPGLSEQAATTEGEARIMSRIAIMMKMESITNATVYEGGENGEKIDDYQVTWTGMPEMMAALDGRVAAVADIPMTRMFGRAAEGMNSSGDSQQKDYAKNIAARQELDLRPCLEQLDVALIPSALGNRPEEIWWKFSPLDMPSQKEETDRFNVWTQGMERVQNSGAIPGAAFSKAYQNGLEENGWCPGLAGALAEVPESERFPDPQPDETDPSALTQEGGDKPAEAKERLPAGGGNATK
jgi:phage-related protein (TIGR01555 family)